MDQRRKRPLGKTAEDDQLECDMVIKKARILKRIRGNISNVKDRYEKGRCEKCIEAWKHQKKWRWEGGSKRQITEAEEPDKKKYKEIVMRREEVVAEISRHQKAGKNRTRSRRNEEREKKETQRMGKEDKIIYIKRCKI